MSEAQAGGEQLGRDWWRTAIIDMQPGIIRYRGYAVEDLIRQRTSLAQMVWLMTRTTARRPPASPSRAWPPPAAWA